MAKKGTHVAVGKRTLELTNLEKVLYPNDDITKAEIIQYYLGIAPTMLSHIARCPLSLIRFPHGIDGEQFFQKNRPDWAPDWVEYAVLGSNNKEYVLATEDASLIWLSNLACLELHQMQVKSPKLDKAYYMVFDLDPPEGFNFRQLIEIAVDLRDHISSYGYHVFVKTTGGKGLHLTIPVNAKYSVDDIFEAASIIAKPFVQKNSLTTLNIKKDARKGRVLIDIYRNRNSQTVICPYSLRGRDGAPVATPLEWTDLEALNDPLELNLRNVVGKVNEEGDPWEGIWSFSTDLHTKSDIKAEVKKLPVNPKRKTPAQLDEYSKKRDFDKTPEPKGLFEGGDGTGFVIHRHSASHLHYDLRLEQDGVLKSWAVPKGMPSKPGIKRLAVATEDHPMKYITFEGEIPKGQYGGGMMWIYANGKYEITKEKKDGFYFKLNSKGFIGEFRMHLMKEKEWLLERVDHLQQDLLDQIPSPMLAKSSSKVPIGDYLYEMKWDGIRAVFVVNEGHVSIWTRNLNDITDKFPELSDPKLFRSISGVFDGEIVCLGAQGKPSFKKVIHRMHRKGEKEIERAMKKDAAYAYLFDCLYLDGKLTIHEPLIRRKAWLQDSIKKGTNYRISETLSDGKELLAATKKLGLEGIMAKEINGLYTIGKRTEAWIKIKNKVTDRFRIIGYVKGKGDRSNGFGALHLADRTDSTQYRGKVGTGYSTKKMLELYEMLQTLGVGEKKIEAKLVDDKESVWLDGGPLCQIKFTELTENQTLRDPVFVKLLL